MARIPFFPLALAVAFLISASGAHTQTQSQIQPQKGVLIQLSPTATPLVFEPNRGQAASNFQWIGRGAGFRFGITSDDATLEFRDRTITTPSKPPFPDASQVKAQTKQKAAQSTLVKLHLSGSTGWKATGASPTGGVSNYFIGKTSANWHTDIPQYA